MDDSRNLEIVVSMKGLDMDASLVADLGDAIRTVVADNAVRAHRSSDVTIGQVRRDGGRVSIDVAVAGSEGM